MAQPPAPQGDWVGSHAPWVECVEQLPFSLFSVAPGPERIGVLFFPCPHHLDVVGLHHDLFNLKSSVRSQRASAEAPIPLNTANVVARKSLSPHR